MANDVVYLELEDGTLIYPQTIETEFGDYWHDFYVYKPKPRKP